MTRGRLKNEWKNALLLAARPSTVISLVVWVVLQAGAGSSDGVLHIMLSVLAAFPAIVFGKNLK